MKKLFHTLYGLGAAVVLLGAVLEFRDQEFFGVTGLMAITIGLCTEAFVFFISAFDYSSIQESEDASKWRWVIKKEKQEPLNKQS